MYLQARQWAGEKPKIPQFVTHASTGGLCMPTVVIFKAGKVNSSSREAAPSGYVIRCSETGYINQQLFAEYGELFVRFLKEKSLLGNNQKVLLLLDSHKSHLFMTYMSANGVEVCCSPPIILICYSPLMMCHLHTSRAVTRRNLLTGTPNTLVEK